MSASSCAPCSSRRHTSGRTPLKERHKEEQTRPQQDGQKQRRAQATDDARRREQDMCGRGARRAGDQRRAVKRNNAHRSRRAIQLALVIEAHIECAGKAQGAAAPQCQRIRGYRTRPAHPRRTRPPRARRWARSRTKRTAHAAVCDRRVVGNLVLLESQITQQLKQAGEAAGAAHTTAALAVATAQGRAAGAHRRLAARNAP